MRDEALIEKHIVPDPLGVRVADARLRESGTPVWAIVWDWRARNGNGDQVLVDYQISREALKAALAYYRRHRAAIDARLEIGGLRTV